MRTLVVGVVVAILGIANNHNWLSYGRSARVRRLRAEAELLTFLPDGTAKTILARRVEIDTLTHVRKVESTPIRRLFTILGVGMSITAAGGITLVDLSIINIAKGAHGVFWTQPATLITLGVVGAGAILIKIASMQIDAITRDIEKAVAAAT